MNPEWFKNSPAGGVVEVKDPDATYWAFVPKPLPPELALTAELTCALAEAGDAIGELRGLGQTLTNPRLLIAPLVRREAVDSSRIEGTKTTVVELYAYEAQKAPRANTSYRLRRPWTQERADAQEVLNYVHTLEHGLAQVRTGDVDTTLTCDLHKRLMSGVRGADKLPGQVRPTRNWIGGATVEQAEFVPPPASAVPELMKALERYVQNDTSLPPLLRIGLIHYEFETIHPFLDGNGRIGRLLITLLLAKWGLLPLPLLHLSSYLEQHKRDYCDKMMAISGRGLWQDWLVFFLQGVVEQARRSADKVRRLQELQASWRTMLEDQDAPGSHLKLANALFESPIISIPTAAIRLKMSYQGAKKVVEELVKAKILTEFPTPAFGLAMPANMYIARGITAIANRA